jgi:hypothetical protein
MKQVLDANTWSPEINSLHGKPSLGAAASCKSVMRPLRQSFRFCDRESLALFLKGYPSHVVCVKSGFGVRQIEPLQLPDKGGVMQLFTLLSRPGKFQILDGRQNENQDDSRSA